MSNNAKESQDEAREEKTVRMGISLRVSLATFFLVLLTAAAMVLVISINVSRGIADIQIKNMVQADQSLTELVDMELKYVRQMTHAYSLNEGFAEGLTDGDYTQSSKLLQMIYTDLGYVQDALLLDGTGTVVAARIGSSIGSDMTRQAFWDTLSGRGSFYMDQHPQPSPIDASPIIYVAYPIMSNGNMLGAIAVSLDLRQFTGAYISPKKFGENGYPFILDDQGTVVAHPNTRQILTDQSDSSFFIGMQKSMDNHRKEDVVSYTYGGQKKMLVFEPVRSLPWYLAISVNQNELFSLMYELRTKVIVISAVALFVISGFIILFLRTFLIRRIFQIVRSIETAATGDLTVRGTVKGSDEIAYVNNRFNYLMESLETLISNVNARMSTMQDSGLDLSANVEETASAVNQINANIESTEGQIHNQVTNVEETSAAIEQMTKNIESLNRSIENQVASVTQSSAAVEEMIANIRSITNISERAGEQVRSLSDASDTGKTKLNQVTTLIRDVAESSEELQQANALIANIASQTNLLAMNAAIEAAHAGDAGRGFAVVADEIRSLAEMSSQQSKTVKANLKQVKSAIDQVVTIATETNTAFEDILTVVGTVASVFKEIQQSMLEQSSGSEQLLSALSAMREITGSVQTGSGEMTQGNEQILSAVTNLNAISQEVRQAIMEISRGTDEINRALGNISELSTVNKESIDAVAEEAGRFHTGES